MKQYKGFYIPPLVEKERVTCGELSRDDEIGCTAIYCSECIAYFTNIGVFEEWLKSTRKPRTTNKRLLPQARMRGKR